MQKQVAYKSDSLLMSATQSMISGEVYSALSRPVILQQDSVFIRLVQDISSQLATVFDTQKHSAMAICGMGTQIIETCLYNFLEPHESILVLINGIHGQYICDLATRLGYDVDTVSIPWGKPILAENVESTLKRKKYGLVVMVHAESSTGVVSPMAGLGHIVHNSGALFMVDCTTSLGGMSISLDTWHVDIAFSVSHRCLSCPSGLTLLSFSEDAVGRLKERELHLLHYQQSLYALLQQWYSPETAVLGASPVNLLYALHESLKCLLNEELHNVFLRHRSVQKLLVDGMTRLGFRCYASSAWRLPMVTVLHMPEDLSARVLRDKLLGEYGIDIRDTVGEVHGCLRVGHMGHTARSSNIARFLEAVSQIVE